VLGKVEHPAKVFGILKYLRMLTGRSHVRFCCSISEQDENHSKQEFLAAGNVRGNSYEFLKAGGAFFLFK